MGCLRQLLLANTLVQLDRQPGDLLAFQRLTGPAGELAGVTAACFLLNRSQEHSVLAFLEQVVPRLLAQLHRSTHPKQVHLHNRVRGRVDPAATLKARCSGNQDTTLFVCRQSWRLFDLPENRLLKHLLARLRRCQESVPGELRAYSIWQHSGASDHRRIRVSDHLALIAHQLRRHRKNIYLREVELSETIGNEHLLAAMRTGNPFYTQMADFYRFYVSAVERPVWQQWADTFRYAAPLLPEQEARTLERMTAP